MYTQPHNTIQCRTSTVSSKEVIKSIRTPLIYPISQARRPLPSDSSTFALSIIQNCHEA